MLESIANTITGATAMKIAWKYSRQDIVDRVEQLFSAIKEREDREREALEALWEVIEQAAELAGPAELPILAGVMAGFAPFAAIGAGFMDAADEIKRKESALGFCEGLVMGVMAETPGNVRDYFWRHSPTTNLVFPAGGQISQYYFNAGLALGFANGREVSSRNLAPVFWADIDTRPRRKFGDPDQEDWGRREWIDFYVAIAAAFYRLHIIE